MGRIRFVPTAAFGKLEDGCQQSFGQGGIIFQENGRGRIGHIDRSDKAAGIVLLGEPQQFTRGRLHQFVGCNGLPISQGAEFGILPATLFQRLLVEFQVEGAATAHQGLVFFVGQDELLFDAALPVAVPVRRQVLPKILEGVPAIVITQHDLARNSFHRRHFAHPVQVVILHGGGPVFGRHQEAAPVDADIVPASCQRFLDRVRCLQPHQTVLFVRIQHSRFAHDIVQGPGGTGLQPQDHIMLFAVPRTDGIREVVDRAAQQVQVLHQQRCRKIHRKFHRPAFKPIMGGGCLHVGHQLPRGLRPRLRLLVAHNQAKVQQGPADGIGTVGFQDVFSFFDQVAGNGNPLPLAALYLRCHFFPIQGKIAPVFERYLQEKVSLCGHIGAGEGPAHPDVGLIVRPVRIPQYVFPRTKAAHTRLPVLGVTGFPLLRVKGITGRPGARTRCREDGPIRVHHVSHKPIAFAINRQHTREGIGPVGPVPRGPVIQVIAPRPDAHIRVDGDERVGRSPQGIDRGLYAPAGKQRRARGQHHQDFFHTTIHIFSNIRSFSYIENS